MWKPGLDIPDILKVDKLKESAAQTAGKTIPQSHKKAYASLRESGDFRSRLLVLDPGNRPSSGIRHTNNHSRAGKGNAWLQP